MTSSTRWRVGDGFRGCRLFRRGGRVGGRSRHFGGRSFREGPGGGGRNRTRGRKRLGDVGTLGAGDGRDFEQIVVAANRFDDFDSVDHPAEHGVFGVEILRRLEHDVEL